MLFRICILNRLTLGPHSAKKILLQYSNRHYFLDPMMWDFKVHRLTHTLPHRAALSCESIWVVAPPNCFPPTCEVSSWGGDIQNCVKVCTPLCMKQFPSPGRSSACRLRQVKQLTQRFMRVVLHWCAERRDTARAADLRGRWKNRWRDRGWIRVHCIRMQRKAPFSAVFFFSLGTQAKRVRSCLKCFGALTSKLF